MKQRTPVTREAYVKDRREADAFKRSSKAESWNRLCEDLELDVNGTKNLLTLYQLANSTEKVANRNLSTSKLEEATRF